MVREIEALEKYKPRPIEYRWIEDGEEQAAHGGIGTPGKNRQKS